MKFVVLAIGMVVIAGIFHMLFIMFDYGYNNPDTGAFSRMVEELNETMSPYYRNWMWNNTLMYREFFGIGRFICMALCPILIGVEIFSKRLKPVGGG